MEEQTVNLILSLHSALQASFDSFVYMATGIIALIVAGFAIFQYINLRSGNKKLNEYFKKSEELNTKTMDLEKNVYLYKKELENLSEMQKKLVDEISNLENKLTEKQVLLEANQLVTSAQTMKDISPLASVSNYCKAIKLWVENDGNTEIVKNKLFASAGLVVFLLENSIKRNFQDALMPNMDKNAFITLLDDTVESLKYISAETNGYPLIEGMKYKIKEFKELFMAAPQECRDEYQQ